MVENLSSPSLENGDDTTPGLQQPLPETPASTSPARQATENNRSDETPTTSPIKQPHAIRLPPLEPGSLEVIKKRRLNPSSPPLQELSYNLTPGQTTSSLVIPVKNRNFKSPLISAKRSPSLVDKPIPVLTPPSCAPTYDSLTSSSPSLNSTVSLRRVASHSPVRPPNQLTPRRVMSAKPFIKTAIPLHPTNFDSPICSSSSPSDRQNRIINTPLHALRSKESELDIEIRKKEQRLDTLTQAKKYIHKNEDEKLESLSVQWREAAQKAATYLFNQASDKVERMGGVSELEKRNKKKNSFNYSNELDSLVFEEKIGISEEEIEKLSPEEREEFERMKIEYEEELERRQEELEISIAEAEAKAEDNSSNSKKFTMSYMLNTLNVDYSMLFPNGEEDEI